MKHLHGIYWVHSFEHKVQWKFTKRTLTKSNKRERERGTKTQIIINKFLLLQWLERNKVLCNSVKLVSIAEIRLNSCPLCVCVQCARTTSRKRLQQRIETITNWNKTEQYNKQELCNNEQKQREEKYKQTNKQTLISIKAKRNSEWSWERCKTRNANEWIRRSREKTK